MPSGWFHSQRNISSVAPIESSEPHWTQHYLGDGASCPAYGKASQTIFKLYVDSEEVKLKGTSPTCSYWWRQCVNRFWGVSIYGREDRGYTSYKKGQYFAKISFDNQGTMVALDRQLDTGATCNVITHQDVCIIQQNGKLRLQRSLNAMMEPWLQHYRRVPCKVCL